MHVYTKAPTVNRPNYLSHPDLNVYQNTSSHFQFQIGDEIIPYLRKYGILQVCFKQIKVIVRGGYSLDLKLTKREPSIDKIRSMSNLFSGLAIFLLANELPLEEAFCFKQIDQEQYSYQLQRYKSFSS